MRELKYIKLGSRLTELKELKQLWYGLESGSSEEDYNEVYDGYNCKNVLTYTTEPSRDLSGLLHNSDIQKFYIPSVTFSFSYVNANVYSELIQLLNTDHFYVQYYDYEIMQDVVRDMYMTENSLSNFHNEGANLKGFIGIEVTFVSRRSYENYDKLKNELLYTLNKLTVSGTTGTYGYTTATGEIVYTYSGTTNIGIGMKDVEITEGVIDSYNELTGEVNYTLYSKTANTVVNSQISYKLFVDIDD